MTSVDNLHHEGSHQGALLVVASLTTRRSSPRPSPTRVPSPTAWAGPQAPAIRRCALRGRTTLGRPLHALAQWPGSLLTTQ